MKKAEVNRFNKLYKEHQRALKLQGKAKKTIPDILTPAEIEKLISATRKLRYRVFLLTTYSMGLRLEEALSPIRWLIFQALSLFMEQIVF